MFVLLLMLLLLSERVVLTYTGLLCDDGPASIGMTISKARLS